MSERERQHWVPKFLVKNFVDKDGRLFRLDIKTNVVTKPPPKYVASEISFNEFNIDGRIVSYESKLTKIETQAAPLLKRIVEARRVPPFSDVNRKKICDFLAAQSFRTEAFYKGFDAGINRKDFGEHFAKVWRGAFVVANEIYRRHWVLMEAVGNEFFYLGDNPVVLQRTEDPSDGAGLGFDVSGVEAFMPLSPRFALYVPCQSVSSQMIRGFENAEAVLRGFPTSEAGLQAAIRILSDHSPLKDALTTGVPFPCSTANVENLNYLQCSWAYSALYSHDKNFQFARKVFRDTPQFREAPKVTVVEKGRVWERVRE